MTHLLRISLLTLILTATFSPVQAASLDQRGTLLIASSAALISGQVDTEQAAPRRGFELRFTDFFVFLVAIVTSLIIGYIGIEVSRIYQGSSFALLIIAIGPVVGSMILILWVVLDFIPNRYPSPQLAEYEKKQIAGEMLANIAPGAIEKIEEIDRLNKQSEELEVRSQTLTEAMKNKRSDIVELGGLARDVEAAVASTKESLRQLNIEAKVTRDDVRKVRAESPTLSVVIEQQFDTLARIKDLEAKLARMEQPSERQTETEADQRAATAQATTQTFLVGGLSALVGALAVWFFTPRPRSQIVEEEQA